MEFALSPSIMVDLNTPVVIRRIDPARDREALEACVIDHQNFHRGLEPSWPDGTAIVHDYLTYLQTECAVHDGCIIMARCGEEAAGFTCVVAATRAGAPDDPGPFACVHDLYVKPEHRRRGVAGMLMADAECFARAKGARVLRMGVLDRNEGARRFWATQGFREYTHVLTKRLE